MLHESMNIAFFTDTYTPQVDGVVKSILLYKKALEARGHKVFVFAPKEIKGEIELPYKSSSQDEKNVFRFTAINSMFIPGYPLTIPVSLKTSYKIPKLNLDIVHSHTPVTLGMLGNLVALMENIPDVFTYHTYYSEYAKHYGPIKSLKKSTSKAIKKFEVFYCNRVNHIIAPSAKLKNVLEECGVKNEISILPTGIDLEEFKKDTGGEFRKKWRISDDKKILLFVGRLGTEKNIEFLIKVMRSLKKEKDIILVIVGDGKSRKDFEKIAKDSGLKDRILFCGFLPREETISAFFACNIFVFASKTDTQGLVLGEAAAAGKPIIMVKDCGLSEIVKNNFNGFEVEEKVEDFSERILKLLRDKNLYDKMSSNSKKVALDFSIEKQAEKLEKLYEKIISDYEMTSWRRKMWRELNKEYEVRDLIKKIFE